MKRAIWAAAIVVALASAPAAFATQGEHEVSVGAAGGTATDGPWGGLDARWLYDLTDFWAIGAGIHDRLLWNALPAGRQAVTFEGRFVVDALQWIPSIGGGVGGAIRSGGGVGFAPWAHVDVGADYRPNRKWGVGARFGAEGPVDGTGVAWVGGVYWNWYGGTGIGLDL